MNVSNQPQVIISDAPWEREQDSSIRIRSVEVFCTAPEGLPLVVVKVTTTEPGLYGLGCATFTQRPLAVIAAIEGSLAPFVIGRHVNSIEDIYQSTLLSGYWRDGPVLNNALSGIDMALWDIKGKLANLPVYELWGGKCRMAARLYAHAAGKDFHHVEDQVRAFQEEGYEYIRCQVSVPGSATYGSYGESGTSAVPPALQRGGIWDPAAYCRLVPRMFEHLRGSLGPEVGLLHDAHERVEPMQAIGLAKALEPFNLFFLEDILAPEDVEYLRFIRQQSSVPIALGELFVSTQQCVPLVRDRLIDFIRVHISAIGGLTAARKLANLCEFFGVRTAFHGPRDVSPIGHAANLQLDLSCSNFGIQERHLFNEAAREIFPGTPEIRQGFLWSNERSGLGIEFDEKAAGKYQPTESMLNGSWSTLRRADGTVQRP
jgi:mannonate dehydratase